MGKGEGTGDGLVVQAVLMFVDMSKETEQDYLDELAWRIPFGVLLILVMIIGIPCSLVCCRYFFSQNTSTDTGTYFKHLYTLINSLDFLVILLCFPLIQLLLLGDENLLFHTPGFCHTWYALWAVTQQMVIFMVAMLSVSRLVFLKYPHLEARPWCAWAVPAGAALLVFLTLYLGPLLSKRAEVTYMPRYYSCQIAGKQLDDQLEELYKSLYQDEIKERSTRGRLENVRGYLENIDVTEKVQDLDFPKIAAMFDDVKSELNVTLAMVHETFVNKRVMFFLRSLMFGLPVLPIFVSFVLCWMFLRQANARAKKTNATVMRHGQASSTVLVVTLVYVIFNIPVLIFTLVLVYNYTIALTASSEAFADLMDAITIVNNFVQSRDFRVQMADDAIRQEVTESLMSLVEWKQENRSLRRNEDMFGALCFLVLPVLNSCVNPFLFYWRLLPFRRYLHNHCTHPN